MGIFSNTSNFDVLVEKATSQLLLEPDWNSILQICDCVRQEDVNPKYAVAVMKRKIYDKNPHVAKYGLIVLEACVKNCGAPMHKEVATKDMMDSFRELAKSSPEPVKEQILSMIQTWSMAFRKEPKYKIVQDTFNLMRMEGYKFPPISESSDALFTAETAPEWAEGDVCHMCRVKFSTFQRQHHCRNCGQVFCQKCSSRVSIIPQYGIEREVRVCDPCFYKLNPSASKNEEGSKKSDKVSTDSDLPPEYLSSSLSRESQTPPKKSAKEIQEEEEEELQLAMALSLSQEEAAKDGQIRPRIKSSTYSEASEPSYSSHKQTSNLYSSTVHDVEPDSASMDPELARYLNRSYWEERNERQTSSAPASAPVQREELNSYSEQKIVSGILKGKKKKKGKKTPSDNFQPVDGVASETSFEVSDAMVKTFQGNVVMLLDRMQKVSAQGKHIAMDATAQSLFQTVSAMHPQILRLIELQEEEKAKYEALQVKLGLVREARSSLDEMRKQHREKVRQQELEQDTLRRLQIEEKLELMRQQKAEYLAYQQRLQAERQATIEQQQQQQQRVQYQRPIQMQQYHYTAGGDSSPYSSLNYTPITLASSQPYTPQNAPASYTSAVPQGYQVPDAPLPSQYAAHPPSSGFLQAPPTNLMPLRNDGPTSQMEFQPQPSSLEYQPPTYASQVPPDQGSASLQPRSLGGPPPVPTAPAQVTAQAPPPQYAQVTSQHPSSQQPYGQLGGQHPPAQTQPQNLIPGAAPTDFTGQPQINPVAPSQSHLQYSQQTQLSSTRSHVPEVTPPSQLTNLPQTQPLQQGIPTQYAHPGARDTQPKPQPYQAPQRNGFPPVDASQGQPPLFSSGSVHSQLNVGQPSVHPSFQQGQPGVHSLQGPTMQQGLPMQQGPPLQQGAPLQQGPPMQQVYEPQQQQPQQLTPQQGYQPGPGQGLPSQQQPPSQYYGSAPPPQQSNPAPQRQLSDLELISFD